MHCLKDAAFVTALVTFTYSQLRLHQCGWWVLLNPNKQYQEKCFYSVELSLRFDTGKTGTPAPCCFFFSKKRGGIRIELVGIKRDSPIQVFFKGQPQIMPAKLIFSTVLPQTCHTQVLPPLFKGNIESRKCWSWCLNRMKAAKIQGWSAFERAVLEDLRLI